MYVKMALDAISESIVKAINILQVHLCTRVS